jgi:hypothetical protein
MIQPSNALARSLRDEFEGLATEIASEQHSDEPFVHSGRARSSVLSFTSSTRTPFTKTSHASTRRLGRRVLVVPLARAVIVLTKRRAAKERGFEKRTFERFVGLYNSTWKIRRILILSRAAPAVRPRRRRRWPRERRSRVGRSIPSSWRRSWSWSFSNPSRPLSFPSRRPSSW